MATKQTETERQRRSPDWAQPQNLKRQPIGTQPSGFSPLKILALLTTGGLLSLGLLILLGIWRSSGDVLNRLRAGLTVSEPPAQVDLRSLVVQQVRGASELTTAVYSMESVVPASRERTLGNYVIGKTTLLYIAHGEVRAGVDLAAMQPADVQLMGDSITVRLPPPQILDSKIDVNRSQVYDYDRGFMGLGPDVAPELQELAQRETLSKVVEAACTEGILQTANERAKLAVTQLLATAGHAQLSVEIQPPAPDACQVAEAMPANLPPAGAPAQISPAVTPAPALP